MVQEKLYTELEKISKFIAYKYNLKNQVPTKLTEEEEIRFKNAETCLISERGFKYFNTNEEDLPEAEFDECIDPNDDIDPDEVSVIHERYIKERDDWHLSGKYRGAAHNIFNMNLKLPQNIPVVFYNMSGYDTHLYIRELTKKYGKVDLMANTDEICINCSINSGYGYVFDTEGKPRKFIEALFF